MKDLIKMVFLVILIIGCFYLSLKIPNPMYEQEMIEHDQEKIVHIERSDGTIDQVPLESYLYGVVGCEMSPSYEMEALKAQSVAARTFVLSRNLYVDDSTASQVYMDENQLKKRWGSDYEAYHQKIKQAVDETKGQYLSYQGEVISALFHAMSCGKTNNNSEYFGSDAPYLKSVDSSVDLQCDDYQVTTTFLIQELCMLLKVEQFTVESIERYESGYVKSIMVNGLNFSGRAFREALSLRSSAFTIEIIDDQVNITTQGYGHGVGMSQRGALAMAKQGKNYQEILQHYYQGVEIKTLE